MRRPERNFCFAVIHGLEAKPTVSEFKSRLLVIAVDSQRPSSYCEHVENTIDWLRCLPVYLQGSDLIDTSVRH